MPKGDACYHRNCLGGECKSLTSEELIPSEADFAVARGYVYLGWVSTSNKFRQISRILPGNTAEDLLKPEVLNTPIGQHFKEMWERELRFVVRGNGPFVQHLTLPVKQYIAFRKVGGRSA